MSNLKARIHRLESSRNLPPDLGPLIDQWDRLPAAQRLPWLKTLSDAELRLLAGFPSGHVPTKAELEAVSNGGESRVTGEDSD